MASKFYVSPELLSRIREEELCNGFYRAAVIGDAGVGRVKTLAEGLVSAQERYEGDDEKIVVLVTPFSVFSWRASGRTLRQVTAVLQRKYSA